MTLPQLPTDNLYKFIALAGLALFGVCTIYPMQVYRHVFLQSEDLRTKIEVANLEADAVSRQVGRLEAAKDNKQQDVDIVRSANQSLAMKLATIGGDRRKIAFLQDQMEQLVKIGKAGSGTGLSLSFFGFLLWYLRVQRPQDLQVLQVPKADTVTILPKRRR